MDAGQTILPFWLFEEHWWGWSMKSSKRLCLDLSVEFEAEGDQVPVESSGGSGVKHTWVCLLPVLDLGWFLHSFWVATPSFINKGHSRTQGWHSATPSWGGMLWTLVDSSPILGSVTRQSPNRCSCDGHKGTCPVRIVKPHRTFQKLCESFCLERSGSSGDVAIFLLLS